MLKVPAYHGVQVKASQCFTKYKWRSEASSQGGPAIVATQASFSRHTCGSGLSMHERLCSTMKLVRHCYGGLLRSCMLCLSGCVSACACVLQTRLLQVFQWQQHLTMRFGSQIWEYHHETSEAHAKVLDLIVYLHIIQPRKQHALHVNADT